jgi:hypothetical protein
MTKSRKKDQRKRTDDLVGSGALFGGVEAKLWQKMQLKADMFDYLCWLEDFCCFRQAALDGKAGDYLVIASDGTTCWGKTYAEAVRVAMEHDKEMHDATSSPNIRSQTHPNENDKTL